MILCSRSSTSSRVQEMRPAFCAISSPETATPPQLLALPGAYQIGALPWNALVLPSARAASKTSMASWVDLRSASAVVLELGRREGVPHVRAFRHVADALADLE